MWLNKERLLNILLYSLIAFFLASRAPDIWRHFQNQGNTLPEAQVVSLLGKTYSSTQMNSKHIIVFWATWCPPCEVELSRINQLIVENKLKADQVIAISSQEDPDLVRKTQTERGYLFDPYIDPQGEFARKLKVRVTPTILFIDEFGKINWMSSGLSPSLELRISQFL